MAMTSSRSVYIIIKEPLMMVRITIMIMIAIMMVTIIMVIVIITMMPMKDYYVDNIRLLLDLLFRIVVVVFVDIIVVLVFTC